MRLLPFGIRAAFTALAVFAALVQTAMAGKRSVTATEVNGTWRQINGESEIKVLALGHGKLKVELMLVYAYQSGAGVSANTGQASGEATIKNDAALLKPNAEGMCNITMTFLPNGRLKVEQQGDDCGFGHNVRVDGTYRKVDKRKPKFGET